MPKGPLGTPRPLASCVGDVVYVVYVMARGSSEVIEIKVFEDEEDADNQVTDWKNEFDSTSHTVKKQKKNIQ